MCTESHIFQLSYDKVAAQFQQMYSEDFYYYAYIPVFQMVMDVSVDVCGVSLSKAVVNPPAGNETRMIFRLFAQLPNQTGFYQKITLCPNASCGNSNCLVRTWTGFVYSEILTYV